MKERSEHIQKLLDGMPDKPGCYQYFNDAGELIYVGKAKSLRKRVYSYFNKDIYESGKTALMVRKIADIKFIITETELDALLLENNLIKKHQPRYNVLLKDDKTYPWIVIKSEPFPRVFYTRRLIRDGSLYFGPFASVHMIRTLLDMIHQLYKLRNCSLNLTDENIGAKKFKVCLEYHIKNCLGPCEGLQQRSEYDENIEEIKQILKGNISYVLNHLETVMKNFAAAYEFENAQMVKEKYEILENYRSKSVVVSPVIHNVDVFTIVSEVSAAFVNYMKVINGAIIQAQTIEMKKKLEEDGVLDTASGAVGLPVSDSIGPEFGVAKSPSLIGGLVGVSSPVTGFGPAGAIYPYGTYGIAESVIDWMNKDETQARFAKKYGSLAEKKMIETGIKLTEAGNNNEITKVSKSFTQIRESWDARYGGRDMGTVPYSHAKVDEESPAWTRKEGQDPKGGLNRKGIDSYRRANPGSKLSMAVTTKPSKLKKGSKAWKRRKSYCARSEGQMRDFPKAAKDPNSRLRKARRKWNCEE